MDLVRLGELIRAVRKEKGWSQDELAERSGLNASTISLLERGKHAPELGTLMRIVEALGMDFAEFTARLS